jgi:hypothetical protein
MSVLRRPISIRVFASGLLTKTFGSLILMSGQVVEQIDPARYELRFLIEVQVKGTSRPLALYEVCDADPGRRRQRSRGRALPPASRRTARERPRRRVGRHRADGHQMTPHPARRIP